MTIDLLLTLDDDLLARVRQCAEADQISIKEWVRLRLVRRAGSPCRSVSLDADTLMRPMVALDLRT